MNALSNLIQFLNDPAWAAFVVDAAAKGLVVLAGAWAASLALRRASAATRHLVWALALTSLVVIPVLSVALPSLAPPVLPQPEAPATPPVARVSEGAPASAPTVEAAPPRYDSLGERPSAPPTIVATTDDSAALKASHDAARPAAASSARITSVLRHWRSLLVLVWAAGALAALLPLLVAALSLRRMAHAATPVDENWVRLAADLSAQLHLRRKVRLVQSDKATIPMTWGVLRPAIVLPPCADDWPLQRRRAVLLHELAHVERCDSLTQTLARIGCAAHWFNPLAWFAFGRLITEREHASDDRVLAIGLKASDYAGHIVEVARAIRGAARVNVAAIAFARSARIDRRLGALLDATRRRGILSTRGIIAAALLAALVCVPLAMVHAQAKAEQPSPRTSDIQARGGEILKKMAEVNRYWLVSPPDSVKEYSYDFTLADETTTFQVGDAANAGRFVRQGISFYSPLHAIARDPSLARIAALEIGDKTIRVVFALGEPMKQAFGNGIQDTWRGYMEQRVAGGTLLLDAGRLVPLEMTAGGIDFVFSRYADVGGGHFVPLDVKLTETGKEGMTFHWEFAVYAPGLWLLDKSIREEGVIASVSNVTVNGAPAQAARSTSVGVESRAPGQIRQRLLSEGLEKAEAVVNANRAWLLPPLDARRGLVHEYRQEEPYLERIMFDENGNIMAQLEKTKESPDKPTRQVFYGADGTLVRSNAGDEYVKVNSVGVTKAPEGADVLNGERYVNNLATGLALDCALTRLARNPEDFQIEVEPVDETTYRLILTPTGRGAALFAGTMLAFTSWAYMHDVAYARSEILCDAATNCPLDERDLDADGKLVGSYKFFDYMGGASGAAPGRITAIVPYEKDGQDQSLEMDARFVFARVGVWLLEEVTSKFRGSQSGSTGRVTIVPATPESLAPLGDMLARLEKTKALLSAVSSAPEGEIEIKLTGDTTQTHAWAKAEWTKKAAEDYGGRGDATIAVGEMEVIRSPDRNCTVAFTVLSDAYQREYRVTVSVELLDSSGRFAATPQVVLDVRALDAPATRRGAVSIGPVGDVALVKLKAEVVTLTAAYHGHGMWMTFVEKSDDQMKARDKPATMSTTDEVPKTPPTPGESSAGTAAKGSESSGIVVLREDDGLMKGRKSIAGSGHFVKFQCPPGKWYLTAVEIYGSRYGYPQAPQEDWTFAVCGTDFKTVRAIRKPYSIFERASERWNKVDLPPLALPSYAEGETPKDFWVNVAFNPEQTKGVYLGYDAGTNGNTLVAGLPDQRPEALPDRGNWMVRLDITQTPPDEVSPQLGKWLKPPVELANDDGKSNGQKSYGGAGPAVHFEGVSRGATLEGFSIYGSMYGGGFNPADTYADYQVTDDAGKVILAGRFAYSLFGGSARWVDVHTEKVEVPQSFWVLVDPHAAQRKGIYFHYDTDAKTAWSKVGTKFDDLNAPEKRWEWMIRAYVRESEENTK